MSSSVPRRSSERLSLQIAFRNSLQETPNIPSSTTPASQPALPQPTLPQLASVVLTKAARTTNKRKATTVSGRAPKRAKTESRKADKVEQGADGEYELETPFNGIQDIRKMFSRMTKPVSPNHYQITQVTTTKEITTVTRVTKLENTTEEPLDQHPDVSGRRLIVKLKLPATGESLASEEKKNSENTSINEIPAAVGAKTVRAPVVRMPKEFWDNVGQKLKFGESPYKGTLRPLPEECEDVFYKLQKSLREHDGTIVKVGMAGTNNGDGPAHGAKVQKLTVDALVRTILSQATSNKSALVVQHQLRNKFTYTVNEEEVVGKIPNYHKMLLKTENELATIIQRAGLHNIKAASILGALQGVYEINKREYKSLEGVEMGNPLNAPDFVPGLLSIDFLKGKSMVEQANWLLNLRGIGTKTAVCILEFNFEHELCAVDTHIMHMAAWLGWLPEGLTNANHAFNHLDGRIPGHLKHPLHQAFWHHRQKCIPCKRKLANVVEEAEKQKADNEVCPLEKQMKRYQVIKKWSPKKEPGVKVQNPVKQEPDEFKGWRTFKSGQDAAAAGYAEDKFKLDDDFDTGSPNTANAKIWKYRGISGTITSYYQTIKKEPVTTIAQA